MMKNSASVKAAILIGIALLLLIPLSLLQNLVAERVSQRDSAVSSVAHGWGDRQWLSGPIIAVPVTSGDDNVSPHDWYVLPDILDFTVDLQVQQAPRAVGTYRVPVYVAHVRATGEFDIAREISRLNRSDPGLRVHLSQARLLLPVNDLRGLRSLHSASREFQDFEPSAGFPIPTLAATLSPGTDVSTGRHGFDLTFDVAGTQALQFLPLARTMRVHSRGNWPDPGFTAGFLPLEHRIDAAGFSANWQILDFNRSYGDRWFQDSVAAPTILNSGFGIDLVQPVDIYQRSTRAVKYGGLFIALSFMTLFLVESRQRRPIHPIQYGLMGLALSVFYLLLLALSEHIGFSGAYVLATISLCTLVGLYLAGALANAGAGVASGTIFAATYALLYLLVTTDNYALLAGSIALFTILTVVMLMTRRLDWYAQQDLVTASIDSASQSEA
ncbi:MAG TPA: cell envelope integrity protein CreD [Steroidobacteraceae bacterium]|nr:cell envelope integrity protein CreD [Steroidobacteraceae bacterium]